MIADDYNNKQDSSSITRKEQGMRGKGFLALCTDKKIQACVFMHFHIQRVLNSELNLGFQYSKK